MGTSARLVTSRRQQWRWAILLTSLLLFPVSMNYFSPYLVIDGAAQGIVSGSLLVFTAQFLSGLLFGRAYCGWVCPAGALQDVWARAKPGPARGGRWNLAKWVIWAQWVAGIAAAALAAGGFRAVNPLHLTETGISVDEPMKYATYFTVLALFVGLALALGRRDRLSLCLLDGTVSDRRRRARKAAPAPRRCASLRTPRPAVSVAGARGVPDEPGRARRA